MTPSEIVARERVAKAMTEVEAAHRALDRACQQLSPIVGGAVLWKRAAKQSDNARALWDALDALEQGERPLTMDGVVWSSGGRGP